MVLLLLGSTCPLLSQGLPIVGNRFKTVELDLLYGQPIGEFGQTLPNPQSGFALGGGGFSLGGTVQRYRTHFNLGVAIEFKTNWQRVHHPALQEELEIAFATPNALGTEFLPSQRNWKFFTASLGPVLGYRMKKFILEGRLMFGILGTGNPYYVTDLGTYIPPGWERFFLSNSTKTGQSLGSASNAFTPKLGLHYSISDFAVIQLSGSLLRATLQQEMEIIDTVVQSGSVSFQRRQASFEQKVRLLSIGAGISLRFYK